MVSPGEPRLPLAGLRVLEYGQWISAPFCTKLLADMGAEVIKVEEPEVGDASRRHGPFPGDLPHPERSGLFLFLNTNKYGVTLNLKSSSGAKIFSELSKTVDLLVENCPPGYLYDLNVGVDTLMRQNPRLVVTSITPFGQSGPYSKWRAYDINSCAASGWSLAIGEQGREPLTPPLSVGHFVSGLQGAVGSLGALRARDLNGDGQHVDISEVESQNNLITGTLANAFVYYGRTRSRHGHRLPNIYPYTVLPCRDGYVWLIAIRGYQWKRFLEIVGAGKVPEWYENDPRFSDRRQAAQEHADVLDALLAPWLMAHTREEIFALCREKHIPFSPVRNMEEVVNDSHLNARGFFAEMDHPSAGHIRLPGAPYMFSKTPWSMRRYSPLLGQHNEEVYCGRLGYTKEDLLHLAEQGVI